MSPGRSSAPLQAVVRLAQESPGLARIAHGILRTLQTHYTAGVVGVVLNAQQQILVVEHAFHPMARWGLPGGWMQGSENPAEALERELAEETGLPVCILQPLLVETRHYLGHHLDLSFLCRALGEVQSLSPELLDYRWLEPSALPPLLPFHAASVAQALAHQSDSEY